MQLFIRTGTIYCLPALIGAIRGTSKVKFFQELGLESLQHRRWYRKLSYFYKFYKNELLHLFKLIPIRSSEYSTRSMQSVPFFKTRDIFLKNNFSYQSLYKQSLAGTQFHTVFRIF